MRSRLIALLLCLMAWPALAAVTPNSFVSPQTPNRGVVRFVQGTDAAGTYKTLYTAGANGSRCYTITESNTDASVAHAITVQIFNGGNPQQGIQILSTQSAGNNQATTAGPDQIFGATANASGWYWPSVSDQYGNHYLQLISGDTVQGTYATNMTGGAYIGLYAICADF